MADAGGEGEGYGFEGAGCGGLSGVLRGHLLDASDSVVSRAHSARRGSSRAAGGACQEMEPAGDCFLHVVPGPSRCAGAGNQLAGPQRPFLPPAGGTVTAESRAAARSPGECSRRSAPFTR